MIPTRPARLAGLLVALALVTAGCASAGAAGPEPRPLTEGLDAIVARWYERAWAPGVAVSVRQGDALHWTGAGGYSELESEAPMRADLPMYIASVTKPFVAATVFALVEDGRIDLDAPLSRYVTDLPSAGDVTIRHLLGMRSGIPDYTRSFGFLDGVDADLLERRSRWFTTAELLALVEGAEPDFAAGERFAYSNTNYILLGNVITAVTGRPWWEAMEERVLDPLGLSDTMLPRRGETPEVATGYSDLDRDANRDSLAGRPFGSVVGAAGAAGALVSTVDDLTAFARGALGGNLLTEASKTRMTAVPEGGYEREYGLGVFVHEPDLRTRVIGHTGSMIGYSSVLWYAPEHDLAIAVLVNESGAEPEDLAELLLREVVRRGDV